MITHHSVAQLASRYQHCSATRVVTSCVLTPAGNEAHVLRPLTSVLVCYRQSIGNKVLSIFTLTSLKTSLPLKSRRRLCFVENARKELVTYVNVIVLCLLDLCLRSYPPSWSDRRALFRRDSSSKVQWDP